MKKTASIFITMLIMAPFSFGHTQATADEKDLLIKFTPPQFLKDSQGESQTYGKGVGAATAWADFKDKEKYKYLIAAYSALVEGKFPCELRVIRVKGKEATLMESTVLQMEDEVLGCTEVELRDLDHNNIPEVIVKRILGREDGPPAFFKWDKNRLVSITPTTTSEGQRFNDLNEAHVADNKLEGETLIVDVDPTQPNSPTRFFIMKDGKIVLKESHDYVTFLGKHEKKPVVLNPVLPAEGDYDLEVLNVSDHKRSVRVEILLNGSKVVKPEDFCSNPAPKKLQKRADDDDDEDGNEDSCKRCDPKNRAYAVVNMKKGSKLSVRVFGKKDSKVKITLNKK